MDLTSFLIDSSRFSRSVPVNAPVDLVLVGTFGCVLILPDAALDGFHRSVPAFALGTPCSN